MTSEIALTLAILAAAVVLFVTERLRVDTVALLVLISLALTGLVSPTEALSGFSNPAVVTVWAMFVLGGGLSKTGVANLIGRQVLRLAGQGESRLVIAIMLVGGAMSAFMNNVAVTAMLLPVVVDIARRTDRPPSKLLIPLAFGSLLGGMNTLIGTPPNLLVSMALGDYGLRPFQLFDYTPVGLAVTLAGVAYMVLVGRHLLPARELAPESTGLDLADLRRFYDLGDCLFAVRVPHDSSLADTTLAESRLGAALDLNVVGITRNNHTFLSPEPEERLEAGDTLLVEGMPVGGMDSNEIYILNQLHEAGAEIRVMHEDTDLQIYDIYRFDHAKYLVIDDTTSIILSENFGIQSIPLPNTRGNRGWGAVIRDADVGQYLTEVFERDSNPELDTIVDFWTLGLSGSEPGNYSTVFHYNTGIEKIDVTGAIDISIIMGPDNAHESILAMIAQASESIFIEQLYIKNWGDKINPYMAAAYNASERGCTVRVLLDSTDWNGDGVAENQGMVDDINEYASQHNLDVRARLVEQYYYHHLHNKGVIVDNTSVLVSSINWNENSPTENRELGVIIRNSDAAHFYSDAFWYDWSLEEQMKEESTTQLCLSYWWAIGGAVIVFLAALAALIKRTF